MGKNPVRETRTVIADSGESYTNRIMVGIPATGLVRMEWVTARYSQLIPMNWSQVQFTQFMSGYTALRFQVDDAQNIIVRECLKGDFEWLFLLEHDVVIPDNTCLILNEYMRHPTIPVVSGLYYSRSRPSEPLVFRGRGNSVYDEWQESPGIAKEGQEKVWCDGVPTGCLLIHHSILKAVWDESPEYIIQAPTGAQITRRVFWTPRKQTSEGGMHNMVSGTSDLDWCTRVIENNYFGKAGWDIKEFAPNPKWPFLVDTNLFCKHINMNGEQFP